VTPATLADPPGDRRQLHSFSGENHGCEKKRRKKDSSENSSHGAKGSSQGPPLGAQGSSRGAQGRKKGRAEVEASETRAPESRPEGDERGNVNETGPATSPALFTSDPSCASLAQDDSSRRAKPVILSEAKDLRS
jgi:hypothetical protein